jgi:hypothetical protein
MDTKTSQTFAVEMSYDKATKNKYVFAGPTGSAGEAIYASEGFRVTIEVLD